MDTEKYWFGFRLHGEPSQAVVYGPYSSRELALAARERAKARDVEVSVPFLAGSDAEANEKAAQLLKR